MELNNLVKTNKKKIRVGRGIGTGKGKPLPEGIKDKNQDLCCYKSFEGGQMPLYEGYQKGVLNL